MAVGLRQETVDEFDGFHHGLGQLFVDVADILGLHISEVSFHASLSRKLVRGGLVHRATDGTGHLGLGLPGVPYSTGLHSFAASGSLPSRAAAVGHVSASTGPSRIRPRLRGDDGNMRCKGLGIEQAVWGLKVLIHNVVYRLQVAHFLLFVLKQLNHVLSISYFPV